MKLVIYNLKILFHVNYLVLGRSNRTSLQLRNWFTSELIYSSGLHGQIINQIKGVKFDGLWIDMNEPANFVSGTADNTCPENKYNYPPWIPKIGKCSIYVNFP